MIAPLVGREAAQARKPLVGRTLGHAGLSRLFLSLRRFGGHNHMAIARLMRVHVHGIRPVHSTCLGDVLREQ